MKPQMSIQVFLALATVAWADGVVTPEERAGILSAARSAGYSDEDIGHLSKRIEQPVDLGALALHRLNALERVFAYATAEWVARVDGHVAPQEVEALKALGDRLKLAQQVRDNARNAVLQIAALPAGNRPDRYDLGKLREMLEKSLATAAR